jgi:hypothetical protein
VIGWFMALALVGAFIPTQTRGSRCGFSLLIIGMCCVRSPTFGRDDGRFANSPLKPWFDSLKSGKGPCCSDADGNVVSDADWESKEGGYRVRIAGEWHDVPDNAVMTTPNLYGRTMV